MKKTYLKPTTTVVYIHHTQMLCASPYDDKKSLNVYDDNEDVVQIHHRQHLLSGSPYNDQKAPLETYDDDDDVISDKGNIW